MLQHVVFSVPSHRPEVCARLHAILRSVFCPVILVTYAVRVLLTEHTLLPHYAVRVLLTEHTLLPHYAVRVLLTEHTLRPHKITRT